MKKNLRNYYVESVSFRLYALKSYQIWSWIYYKQSSNH
ncbi:unnamed protein product, partial [Vitis vinifera]|uniref:Uncharacterized protein n=1 Tax=Vitis vinifera TaxID=29760 RepID=D7TA71_VITVI